MRLSIFTTYLALAASAAHALSLPNNNALSRPEDRAMSPRASSILAPDNALEKRKGGGGRGGGGGGSGGKSGGGGSSGGGGRSPGTGPPRSFGGGGYYGGGASTPYAAGKKTPKGLVPGALLGGAALFLIMPGLWLYSVYPYNFNNQYRFVNQSLTDKDHPNGTEVSLPVKCLCQENNDCSCEQNDDKAYLDDLVGNGSYAALNKSLVTVSDIDRKRTLVLNGSLPEGTLPPGESAAVSVRIGKLGGYWFAGMIVVYLCAFM